MASSCFSYAGKGVWIHNAVSEVLFAMLASELRAMAKKERWVVELCAEIEAALSSTWIDGLAATWLERYVTSNDVRVSLLKLLKDKRDSIDLTDDRIEFRAHIVSVEYFAPELEMIIKLIEEPELILMPAQIYVPNTKTWCVA
jgi:hypothetical protein